MIDKGWSLVGSGRVGIWSRERRCESGREVGRGRLHVYSYLLVS